MLNQVAGSLGAKRSAATQQVRGFEERGFACAISAKKVIESGPEFSGDATQIAKIGNF